MGEIEDRVLAVVRSIPPGQVVTYGQVAELAGLPRQARRVGRVLGELPDGSPLPWHRVVAAGGRFALPAGGDADREQRRRLAAEGVVIRGNRVSLAARAPEPDLDALLWSPALVGDEPAAEVRPGPRKRAGRPKPGSGRR
jgi:methylated-DNA-protein-cysteine methyltransferase-like protein